VPEQVADLSEWDAALDQPGGVLVSQVVPVQVDVTKPLLTLGREVLVVPLAPARIDAVASIGRCCVHLCTADRNIGEIRLLGGACS